MIFDLKLWPSKNLCFNGDYEIVFCALCSLFQDTLKKFVRFRLWENGGREQRTLRGVRDDRHKQHHPPFSPAGWTLPPTFMQIWPCTWLKIQTLSFQQWKSLIVNGRMWNKPLSTFQARNLSVKDAWTLSIIKRHVNGMRILGLVLLSYITSAGVNVGIEPLGMQPADFHVMGKTEGIRYFWVGMAPAYPAPCSVEVRAGERFKSHFRSPEEEEPLYPTDRSLSFKYLCKTFASKFISISIFL